MSGDKCLIDTNIALYVLGGDQVLSHILEQKEVFLSFISEMELLAYPTLSDLEMQNVKDFLADCNIVELPSAIKQGAVELRKKHRLKLPDAIIAATSLYLNIPLIS